MSSATPPRYLPDEPMPAYAYVPGHFPHPVSDPEGHSYQKAPPRPPAPDPAHWTDCRDYLRGVDLFNCGYYWEAHEAWEGLWHACGRQGKLADFFKGMIQLAVAGVKVREGRPPGVRYHADRAAAIFQRIAASDRAIMGLEMLGLANAAKEIASSPPPSDRCGILPVLLLLIQTAEP